MRHCLVGHIEIWHNFFYQILKYFNDFQNRKFSVLWINWAQPREVKQNEAFFRGTYSNLTSFVIGCEILKYFLITFIFGIFQFHCKIDHKQVKENIYKSGNIFFTYEVVHQTNDFCNLFHDKVYLKNEW